MIEVVAAIIQNEDSQILITRRKKGKHLEGMWEFPGGKIEKNETDQECLEREILEELSINVSTQNHFVDVNHDYSTKKILLKSYIAKYVSGQISLTDHDKYEWVRVQQLEDYEFAPADIPIVKKLQNEF